MPKLQCDEKPKPRCGETVKVRIKTNPAKEGVSVEPFPANSGATVSPDLASTNKDGYTDFHITCAGTPPPCTSTDVTFEGGSGYESVTVTVDCHPITSENLLMDDISDIRDLVTEAQRRLSALARLRLSQPGAGISPTGASLGELIEIGVEVPLQELEHSAELTPSDVIGYLSSSRQTIFVRQGSAEKVTQALEAELENAGWKISGYQGHFNLQDVSGNPEDIGTEKRGEGPLGGGHSEGDKRVLDNHKCGHRFSARPGECRKLAENLYGKIDYFPFARCRISPDNTCTETFIERGRIKYYSDKDCKTLIADQVLLGWSCIVLF